MDTEKLLKRIEKLEAREAIRHAIHRYARAVDRRDPEQLKKCYWEDAKDDHVLVSGDRDEYVKYIIPVLKKVHITLHSMTNTTFDFNEDETRCFTETYTYVLHRLKRTDGIDGFYDYIHNGRYLDIFEKRNGEWRVFRRRVVMDADNMHKVLDIVKLVNEAASTINPDLFKNFETGDITTMYGSNYPDDAVYRGFDLENVMQEGRPNPTDFWAVYNTIADKVQRDTATDTSK